MFILPVVDCNVLFLSWSHKAPVNIFPSPTNQTCLATNQVVTCCVNTNIRLDNITRESRHKQELRHLLENKAELPTTFCNNFSRNLQQAYLLQDRFDSRVVQRAKSLFASNVSKTSCTFLLHRAKITRKRICCVCVARGIAVRQCFLAAMNSPKWSQCHIRRSLFVLKKRKHHAKILLEGKEEVIHLNSKIASCFHGEVHAVPVVGW